MQNAPEGASHDVRCLVAAWRPNYAREHQTSDTPHIAGFGSGVKRIRRTIVDKDYAGINVISP